MKEYTEGIGPLFWDEVLKYGMERGRFKHVCHVPLLFGARFCWTNKCMTGALLPGLADTEIKEAWMESKNDEIAPGGGL